MHRIRGAAFLNFRELISILSRLGFYFTFFRLMPSINLKLWFISESGIVMLQSFWNGIVTDDLSVCVRDTLTGNIVGKKTISL